MIAALGQTEEGGLLELGLSGFILKAEAPISIMIMILGLGDRHGLELFSSATGLGLTRGERMS